MMLDNTKAVIEALLLVSEKPLTIRQISVVLDELDDNSIRQAITALAREYEEANRGMRILEVAGGFRLVTPAQAAPFLKKFFKDKRLEKLSRPGLETLAIIAYKQPLTKQEIELLRNVNVDGVINSLMTRNLIHITGRKNAPGRPLVFGTTKQFLEYFGLKSLDDLPRMDEFKNLKPVGEENGTEKPAQVS